MLIPRARTTKNFWTKLPKQSHITCPVVGISKYSTNRHTATPQHKAHSCDYDLPPANRRLYMFELNFTGAMMVAFGTNSCSSSTRLATKSVPLIKLMPVVLPAGRLRLGTRPIPTGSAPTAKTIGVLLAALAAFVAGYPPAAITATRRIATLWPSTNPVSRFQARLCNLRCVTLRCGSAPSRA
jgi:hypothetical protein